MTLKSIPCSVLEAMSEKKRDDLFVLTSILISKQRDINIQSESTSQQTDLHK